MRAAAFILIVAISATLVAGAQCVTACAHPTPPPCHHSNQKAAKTCDASFVFGEKQPATIVEAPSAAVHALAPAAFPDAAGDLPHLRPPGDSAPLVLRI
jgi:hypothetical protein